MHMGDYIAIDEQIAPFEFACSSVSTGTPFTARVDGDKEHLFSDQRWIDLHPSACRFLRPDGDLVRCTIHGTRPGQCRAYRCVVMRVSDSRGMPLGTVTGTLALHSDDPSLRAVWEDARRAVSLQADEGGAEAALQKYLEGRGYRVE
jgi:Fe-S-cluster containining protein